MKWGDVRKAYPNRFVKLQVLKSYIKDNTRFIEDVAVIDTFDDDTEATRELVRAKEDIWI